MPKLTEEQMAKGRMRFLAGHPEIKHRIDLLSQDEANALGIPLEDLKVLETMRELREYAYANGSDSSELFWSCVADTAEEFGVLIEARDSAIQRNLGLS